mgnify:CR=1 FL=1
MNRKIVYWTAVMLGAGAPFAAAEPAKPDPAALITENVIKEIRGFIDTDIVRLSIEAQNSRLTELKQDQIDSLDKQWRAERESADKPLQRCPTLFRSTCLESRAARSASMRKSS